jgi:hypothetical protein
MATYATPAEIKRLLGISSTNADQLIGEILSDVVRRIDQYTGRTFGDVDATPSDTTRYFTVGEDTDGQTLYLDDDLATITTVKTNADASTPTTIASTGYTTNPRNFGPYNEIRLKASTNSDYTWTFTDNPEDGIEVTGVWAFSTTPPDDIVRAAKALAVEIYRRREKNEPGDEMPPDVMSILNSYRVRMR